MFYREKVPKKRVCFSRYQFACGCLCDVICVTYIPLAAALYMLHNRESIAGLTMI